MSIMGPVIFKDLRDLPDGVNVSSYPFGVCRELFLVDNPGQMFPGSRSHDEVIKYINSIPVLWVYFPWRREVRCILSEDLYFRMRTARNRDLITEEEQLKFRHIKVGIAGLSVGSAVLEMFVISGGPKFMRIADPDVIETSNLNRMRSSLLDVGQNKAEVAARRVWETDPFAEIEIYNQGLTEANLEKFIVGPPKLDVFVDEMDSIPMKVHSRLVCKKNGVPVIMATDLGELVMLDVERFDLFRFRPIFHGLIEISESELQNISKEKWIELSSRIIGQGNIPARLANSLAEVGKSLSGVPQLGATAAMAAVFINYAVRQIACGEEILSGRYLFDFKEKLSP